MLLLLSLILLITMYTDAKATGTARVASRRQYDDDDDDDDDAVIFSI